MVTIWPSNSAPRYTPKRNKIMSPSKNLHTNVPSTITHHSQKVEDNRELHNRWMDKRGVVYIGNEILFGPTKEWRTDACCNMDKSRNITLQVKETRHTRAHIMRSRLYEMSRTRKYTDTESRLVFLRSGVRAGEKIRGWHLKGKVCFWGVMKGF